MGKWVTTSAIIQQTSLIVKTAELAGVVLKVGSPRSQSLARAPSPTPTRRPRRAPLSSPPKERGEEGETEHRVLSS